MDERKIGALDATIDLMKKHEIKAYMWFAIPTGIITGEPITVGEYFNRQYINGILKLDENEDDSDHRFYYLQDVRIYQGSRISEFRVAVLDCEDVSAWGLFNPHKCQVIHDVYLFVL